MICESCGFEILNNEKYCPECGRKLDIYAYCGECGAQLPENAKYCFKCGTPRRQSLVVPSHSHSPSLPPPPPPQPVRKVETGIIQLLSFQQLDAYLGSQRALVSIDSAISDNEAVACAVIDPYRNVLFNGVYPGYVNVYVDFTYRGYGYTQLYGATLVIRISIDFNFNAIVLGIELANTGDEAGESDLWAGVGVVAGAFLGGFLGAYYDDYYQ